LHWPFGEFTIGLLLDVAIWCPNGIPAGAPDHVDLGMERRGSGSSSTVKFGYGEADRLTPVAGLAGDGQEQRSGKE
jgi:hypothetical protein